MMNDMDALFEQAVTELERMDAFFDLDKGWDRLPACPALDMREEEQGYTVLFSLPEAAGQDVQVLLDGRLLTILTPLEMQTPTPFGRQPVQLQKRVQLPGPVGDVHLASATLTNSTLRIRIPKGRDAAAPNVSVRLF